MSAPPVFNFPLFLFLKFKNMVRTIIEGMHIFICIRLGRYTRTTLSSGCSVRFFFVKKNEPPPLNVTMTFSAFYFLVLHVSAAHQYTSMV